MAGLEGGGVGWVTGLGNLPRDVVLRCGASHGFIRFAFQTFSGFLVLEHMYYKEK